jgi:hypothetical protein
LGHLLEHGEHKLVFKHKCHLRLVLAYGISSGWNGCWGCLYDSTRPFDLGPVWKVKTRGGNFFEGIFVELNFRPGRIGVHVSIHLDWCWGKV